MYKRQIFSCDRVDAEYLTKPFRLGFHLSGRLFCNDLREADIFEYSQTVQEHEILEDKPHMLIPHSCKPGFIEAGEIFLIQQYFAAVVGDKTGDAI